MVRSPSLFTLHRKKINTDRSSKLYIVFLCVHLTVQNDVHGVHHDQVSSEDSTTKAVVHRDM